MKLAYNGNRWETPIFVELAPFALAAASLAWSAATDETPGERWVIAAGIAALALVAATARAGGPWWRAPALLAPLAVLFPWAAVPSHLGVAFGGLPLFSGWLTRYPSWGPINPEIAAGIGCVLGASAMPALHAMVARRTPERTGLLAGIAALALVPVVPVWIRLDLELLLFGVLGVPSLFSDTLVPFPLAAVGPALRAAAVVAVAGGTITAVRRAGRPRGPDATGRADRPPRRRSPDTAAPPRAP